MGLLRYLTQAFSGGWSFEDQEHPFEDPTPKEQEKPKEPYVIYDENGIRIKANGEQLKFILGHLIATAKKSPVLKLWLYLKCVPQEYKKLEIERDYYKGLYEKQIGIGSTTKKTIRASTKPKRPLEQKTTRKYTKKAKS